MITVKIATSRAFKKLKYAGKQAEIAQMITSTRTAWKVRAAEIEGLTKYLDRPTPFTKSAYRVQQANKAGRPAAVYAAPIQDKYLSKQVFGGTRVPVGKVNVLPTNHTKNQYGNLPRNKTKSLLANKKKYFSGRPKGGGQPGIWQRMGTSKRPGGYKIRMMVSYIDRPIHLRKRLPFYQIAQRVADKFYKREFLKVYAKRMGVGS